MKLEDMPQELIDTRPRKPLPIKAWRGEGIEEEKPLLCQQYKDKINKMNEVDYALRKEKVT